MVGCRVLVASGVLVGSDVLVGSGVLVAAVACGAGVVEAVGLAVSVTVRVLVDSLKAPVAVDRPLIQSAVNGADSIAIAMPRLKTKRI